MEISDPRCANLSENYSLKEAQSKNAGAKNSAKHMTQSPFLLSIV